MSTRCSLARGDGWDLYQDWADPGFVMLEWRTEATAVTLRFSVEDWEKIRTAAPQDLNWNLFDIDELVEATVEFNFPKQTNEAKKEGGP